jgi:hypothetical protein
MRTFESNKETDAPRARLLRTTIITASFIACCVVLFASNHSAQTSPRTRRDEPPSVILAPQTPPALLQQQRRTAPPARAQTRAQQTQTRTISQEDPYTDTASIETGQTREYNLTGRENEIVIVSVTSSNFNPAVEIVRASGGRVAQNDDVRAGEQDALILARLPDAGAYRVRVSASAQTTGGQTRAGEYEITVRRFVPVQAEAGGRTEGTLGTNRRQWHRFNAEAGQRLAVSARSTAFGPTIEIYAPNGEAVSADPIDGGEGDGTGRIIFRAAQGGTYYARVAPADGGDGGPQREGGNYTLTIAPVRVTALTGDAMSGRRLDTGGLDIYTFQGTSGEVVRALAASETPGLTVRIVPAPSADGGDIPEAAVAAPDGQRRRIAVRPAGGEAGSQSVSLVSVTALPVSPKATGEAVGLLAAAGTYQIVVSHAAGLPAQYSLTVSRPLNAFRNEGESSGTLALGSSDFWSVEGSTMGLTRIEGLSEQFDTRLEVYSPSGGLLAANDDGAGGRNAGVTFLMNEPGRYILRVHSSGDGGSGPYRLRRGANPARRINLGDRTEGTMQPDGTEIYSFEGRAGQTVIITVRSTEFDPKVALYSPTGTEIGSDDDGGGGLDSLLTRRLPANGTYTVWVTPFSGSGRFTLRVIED